ncbi:MAG: UDP-N-acetylenolpyruvoylglucosamine reductase [Acidimicrobiaceae bacterium]|nr:UDP-N-acetylenolpyruvoylglucosamine reductase [Acidimicrobiaceae bacterium]
MSRTSLAEALEHAAGVLGADARRDEPIGVRTTYRVGGAAALFFEIADERALERVAAAVAESGVDTLVLGRGSNLVVADAGFPGLCVTLAGEFAELGIDTDGQLIEAGGALDYPVLARRASAAGCCGMEWAVGIPGTVGGAVRMNAGGHGAETKDYLVSARLVDLAHGTDRVVSAAELSFSYRRSAVRASEVVCSATFAAETGDPAASAAKISEIVGWRRANQPGGRNAGSVFTNPPGDAAGRIVEAAGLKGLRLGSAEVSPRHANFVQADADGSADDVHRLVREVQRLVAERLGIELSTEVAFVGTFS